MFQHGVLICSRQPTNIAQDVLTIVWNRHNTHAYASVCCNCGQHTVESGQVSDEEKLVEVLAAGTDIADVLTHFNTPDVVTQWLTESHFHRHLLHFAR